MTAFDDLTLGEVEEMQNTALGGKGISEADPLMLAGAVMFTMAKRDDKSLSWEAFKASTRMSDIKTFSQTHMSENGDSHPLEMS